MSPRLIRIVLFGSLVFAVGLMLWVSRTPSLHPLEWQAAPVGTSTHAPSANHVRSHTPVTGPRHDAPQLPSAKLQSELQAATDWRAFAFSAMQRPQEGGYFYSRHVLDLCSRDMPAVRQLAHERTRTEIAATGTVDPHRTAVSEGVWRNCDAFAPGEAGQWSFDVRARAADGRDPLLSTEAAISQAVIARDMPALARATERALQLQDTLLFSHYALLLRIAIADPEASGGQGLIFDGKLIPLKSRMAHMKAAAAIELASCSPGLPCALNDILRFACPVAEECMNHERFIGLHLEAVDATESDWRDVRAMTERVRQAIANRETSFFVRQ